MTFNYSQENYSAVMNALKRAHDPEKCSIRAELFSVEYAFFRENIQDKKVLVAGSGLGHDSFELAKYNKEVAGIEILSELVRYSNKFLADSGYTNLYFRNIDFFNLDYKNKSFDAVILNMGTIGNFEDKQSIIKELTRVSTRFYFDFYKTGSIALEKRLKMYQQEAWFDLKVNEEKITNKLGFESDSISEDKIIKLAKDNNCAVKLYSLTDFVTMAELYC